ncbi:hypothetical protein [Pseudomonas viridiflava]|uniref:hypothetical protein n=1 Tax=Pseudomonas viridiflava TaxID=33069 RepID=UPI0013CEA420|nr:hypothetical protein [Pseudomonas viridiflava]
MLETVVMDGEIRALKGSQRSELSQTEHRLVERFRQITDQEKRQVLRLIEALTLHPETE